MTPYRSYSAGPAGRRDGFSLIEILVVVAVIAILAGISLPFAARMLDSGRAGQTRAMLNALRAVVDEYEIQTGQIPHVTHNENYNGQNVRIGGNDDNTIGYFLARVRHIEVCRSLIKSAVGQSNLELGEDNPSLGIDDLYILDAWNNKIRYIHKVVQADKTASRTDHLPVHPNPYFASAGPDGLWGKVDAKGNRDAAAMDNVYSFEVD